ncbi:hypothetical protein DITRI_Ditri04bG0187200 [Diplodiscus trichospermus]
MPASEDQYEIRKTHDVLEACFYTNKSSDPFCRNESALNSSLPFLLTQLFVVLFVDCLLMLILKPLRQPRTVAHIICGVLLGPTVFGETNFSRKYIIPYRTTMVLETFANLAQVYYMFLVGLEVDFSLVLHSETRVLSVAIAGILFPLLLGFCLYFMVLNDSQGYDSRGSLFWAIALTSTNFQDLTRILADLKLLRSNIGRIAMSSAIISDLCSWLLLVVAISIFNEDKSGSVISIGVFMLICIYALRPMIPWLINQTSRGENNISESHIWFILAAIVLCGFITDGCGSHSIVGAFMFGVIMPQEEMIRSKIIEKLDDFVKGILLPLFFLTSGIRADMGFMLAATSWTMVLLVIFLSCAAKVVGVFFVSLRYNIPNQEALALGLLMNTKGVSALIILNTGRNIKALNNQSFPLMVLTLLVMSSLIEPIMAFAYKPTRSIKEHKNRTIQETEPGSEFRILACVHSMRNVMGTLSLLDLSHATIKSPLSIFAIHLLELSGRACTAMLIVHDGYRGGGNRYCRAQTETNQIIRAFENFEKKNNAVTVETMTVVSPYTTMHMDICSLAEDKCVNLIIIPFHKQLIADGRMGNGNSNFADLNHNLLMNASCSVAILVDRGIGSKHVDSQINFSEKLARQIAMLYIGGPDDREALAYAWRMTGNLDVSLTVARFLPDVDREKQIDDDQYIDEFKFKSINNNAITFTEKIVNSGEETIAAIREMGDTYDLYVIGRRQGEAMSPATSGLSDGGGCPELGPIGDVLGSSNLVLHASVLVVQQYISTDGIETSQHSSAPSLQIGYKQDVESFLSHRKEVDNDKDDHLSTNFR